MRWLAVLALVACSSKPAKQPALAELDRTCAADPDCALADDTCCKGCDQPVPTAVAAKSLAGRTNPCDTVKCPEVTCERRQCWDEYTAVCKNRTCEVETHKAGQCDVPTAETACKTADDCTLMSFHDCCDRCGGTPMNKRAAAEQRANEERQCGTLDHKCPQIDCPSPGIDCVAGKCVTRQ